MGCGPSAFELAVQNNKSMKKDLEQYKLLQLSQNDVGKLFNIFSAMDANGGGTIDLCELLAHIDLPRTAFTTKVFSIFDDNNSGAIDFKEFVLALWNYCTLTKGTLDTFAFDLYDTDSSGELSASEVLRMIQDIFGKSESRTNAQIKQVTAELQDFERRKVVFTIDRFRTFAKTRHAMLFPPFQMLQALQAKIMGTSFWERQSEKRMKLSNGKFLSVGQFIVAHNGGKIPKAQKQYMSLSTPGPSRDDDSHHKPQSLSLGVQPMDLSQVAGPRAKRRQSAAEAQVRAALDKDNDLAGQSTLTTKPSKNSTNNSTHSSLTTSTTTSIASSLSDSAKAVWAASLQGLSTKSTKGILKTNKVHVAASPSKSMNKGAEGSSATIATSSTSSGSILESPLPRRKSVNFPPAITTTDSSTGSAQEATVSLFGAPAAGTGSGSSVVSPRESSVNSTSTSTAARRRGSREPEGPAVIQYTKVSPKNSPKNSLTPLQAAQIGKAASPSGRRMSYGGNASVSVGVSSNNGGNVGSFGGAGAFVPHDDPQLAVKSRARRTTILPGAVEDAQDLTQHMYNRRRSFG